MSDSLFISFYRCHVHLGSCDKNKQSELINYWFRHQLTNNLHVLVWMIVKAEFGIKVSTTMLQRYLMQDYSLKWPKDFTHQQDLKIKHLLIGTKNEYRDEKALSTLSNALFQPEFLAKDEGLVPVLNAWPSLTAMERELLHEMLTGRFRTNAPSNVWTESLANKTGHPTYVVRLALNRSHSPKEFKEMISKLSRDAMLKEMLEYHTFPEIQDIVGHNDIESGGFISPDWPGRRIRIIRSDEVVAIEDSHQNVWTVKLPEYQAWITKLPPGTLIDGILVPLKEGQIQSESQVERRLKLKNITAKGIDKYPLALCLMDVIYFDYRHLYKIPLNKRLGFLQQKLIERPHSSIFLNDLDEIEDMTDLTDMGHKYGDMDLRSVIYRHPNKALWYRIKAPPYVAFGTILYTRHAGMSRFNNQTTYSIGVRIGSQFVPITDLFIRWTEEERALIRDYAQSKQLERFGPVTSILPGLIIEFSYERIERNNRTKSGVKLIRAEFMSWHRDLSLEAVSTLADFHQLLDQ